MKQVNIPMCSSDGCVLSVAVEEKFDDKLHCCHSIQYPHPHPLVVAAAVTVAAATTEGVKRAIISMRHTLRIAVDIDRA